MSIKYPQITVELVGQDGNAFSIIARVGKALRRGGASQEDIAAFTDEAMSGDYAALLATVGRWVNIE